MNPSGGLRWHWQAWRSQALWRPTCEQIASWLVQVQPASKELLLIGASAGWMMPSPWLQRFNKITTWDLDPLAPTLFSWRHAKALAASGTQLVSHTGDALKHIDQVLRSEPKACVFFDNVLGQIRFHGQDVVLAQAEITRIVRRVKGREWGSLHDAYSGPVGQRLTRKNLPSMQTLIQPSQPTLLPNQRWLAHLGAHGDWLDHLTESVFTPGTPVHHIAWPYQARYCHWLQAGWVPG
jgi:hypothetical protein